MLAETRILVADSLEIVRTSLARSLSDHCPGHKVLQAETGCQVIEECGRAPVDLVLLDLSLRSPSGIETLRRIRRGWSGTRVLVQYMADNQREALQALGLGASGAIPRTARAEDFTRAVTALTAGFTMLPADLVTGLIGLRPDKARAGNCYGLTRREIEVMVASVRYGSTRLVSEALRISPRTVEAHRCAIYRKTGCKTPAELQEIAQQFQATVPVPKTVHSRRTLPVRLIGQMHILSEERKTAGM
jgi:DNA-binding NarL/FixJ family response regulator